MWNIVAGVTDQRACEDDVMRDMAKEELSYRDAAASDKVNDFSDKNKLRLCYAFLSYISFSPFVFV